MSNIYLKIGQVANESDGTHVRLFLESQGYDSCVVRNNGNGTVDIEVLEGDAGYCLDLLKEGSPVPIKLIADSDGYRYPILIGLVVLFVLVVISVWRMSC